MELASLNSFGGLWSIAAGFSCLLPESGVLRAGG